MSRSGSYWTRKLELELIEFIKQRECVWKPVGNTNHDIQKKYKAYAEFAALLDRGFTARTVRDRWVNIRSTFNHYLRKVEKSKTQDQSGVGYTPCWPLWRPLQFLREGTDKGIGGIMNFNASHNNFQEDQSLLIKRECQSDLEDNIISLRQWNQRTDRPRNKLKKKISTKPKKKDVCKNVLDNLLIALRPLAEGTEESVGNQSYWFFGRHVTERLNEMSANNADNACREIMAILAGEDVDKYHVT
ncbi:uncharacterized protein LOC105385781 [Plutella xylostella]|uniref:uncharacterized protein LOC105385781 n=1 Tax=Plutella xylostella TaxID=51655 RepID=UPI002032B318|nr:uncharacterized protein LOC105385781 [Plutella xylostella]